MQTAPKSIQEDKKEDLKEKQHISGFGELLQEMKTMNTNISNMNQKLDDISTNILDMKNDISTLKGNKANNDNKSQNQNQEDKKEEARPKSQSETEEEKKLIDTSIKTSSNGQFNNIKNENSDKTEKKVNSKELNIDSKKSKNEKQELRISKDSKDSVNILKINADKIYGAKSQNIKIQKVVQKKESPMKVGLKKGTFVKGNFQKGILDKENLSEKGNYKFKLSNHKTKSGAKLLDSKGFKKSSNKKIKLHPQAKVYEFNEEFAQRRNIKISKKK